MHMCTVAASSSSAVTAQRPVAAAQRQRCLRVQADQKGFSGSKGQQLPKQIKKSKRGKVASRPSPKRTLEELQADQAAYEAATLARRQGSAGSGSSGDAPATPAAAPARLAATRSDDSSLPSTSGSPTVEYGSAEAVPEAVTDRMLKRIVIFMGVPVFSGILLFPLFYWLKVKQEVDLPFWVPYLASSLTFGGGLLGISYGIMSASWEPRREGSFLGWTEFQANVPLLLERFKRK